MVHNVSGRGRNQPVDGRRPGPPRSLRQFFHRGLYRATAAYQRTLAANNGEGAPIDSPPMLEWEDADRLSFYDSDRFEEDSLCSWSSEPESLCNNWRGWKKPTPPQATVGQYGSAKKFYEGEYQGPCLFSRSESSHSITYLTPTSTTWNTVTLKISET